MFLFIPRKVAYPKISSGTNAALPSQANVSLLQSDLVHGQNAAASGSTDPVKGKQTDSHLPEEDCAVLVCLSLSNHTLWSDSTLRRTVASGDEGFIPLKALLQHSPFWVNLPFLPPAETVVVKAVRAHCSDVMDVRLLVSEPHRESWSGDPSASTGLGGYEIRRKDWRTALQQARHCSRQDWQAKTVYVENIPVQYRSIPNISRFITTLLASSSSPSTHSQPVQGIWLPSHFRDRPEDPPKCKGFALITLAETDHANVLLSQWPWERHRPEPPNDAPETREATKFGLRVLPKERWDRLKEEYLAHRQKLVDKIASAEAHAADEQSELAGRTEISAAERQSPASIGREPAAPESMDPASQYPHGCLVFVRNVHPETNKTALRSLLSQAFPDDHFSGDALDYVDFSKGMDTCYIRLATPQHSHVLAAYFETYPKAQTQGLDGIGTPAFSSSKAIMVEIIDGTREKLYWDKVPEKVRRQAAEKAVARQSITNTRSAETYGKKPDVDNGKRKRKRRKRNHDST